MSDLSAPLRGTHVEDEPERFSPLLKALSSSTGIYSMPRRRGEDTVWYQDLLHGVGKIEEYSAKTLGQLLTDDPKYQNIFGPSNYHDQVLFANLMYDLGLNEENLGSFGPLAAMIGGIGLAIANPIDPVNKFRLAGVTRKGAVGQVLKATGRDALTKVGEKGKRVWQFDPKKITNRIQELRDKLDKGIIQGSRNRRYAKRTISRLKTSLNEMEEINPIFRTLQEQGVKLEDITLAPTLYEQSVKGQARLLGFSSVFSPDQLSLLGFGRGPIAQSVRVGLPGAVDSALIAGGSKLIGGITSPIKGGFRAIMKGMGYPVIETERAKGIATEVARLYNEHSGRVQDFERELVSLLRRSGLTDDQVALIRQSLEKTVSPERVRLFDEVVNNLKIKEPNLFTFSTAREIRLQREQEARKAALGSQLTPEEELRLTPSGLTQEDILRAKEGYNTSQYRGISVGEAAHSARLLPNYIVMEANSPKAITGQLTELDEIYGQKVWIRDEIDGKPVLIQRRLPHAVEIGHTYSKADGIEYLRTRAAELTEEANSKPRGPDNPRVDYRIREHIPRVRESRELKTVTAQRHETEQILRRMQTDLARQEAKRKKKVAYRLDIREFPSGRGKTPKEFQIVRRSKAKGKVIKIERRIPIEQASPPAWRRVNEIIDDISSEALSRAQILRRIRELAQRDPDAASLLRKQIEKGRTQLVAVSQAKGKVTKVIDELDPKGMAIIRGGDFTELHLENLEQIAAQLATRGRTLVNIRPSDILVTPFGGVQIINPDVIRKSKALKGLSAKDRAAKNSAEALNMLADELGLAKGISREFHFLKSGATADRAEKGVKGMRFKRAVPEGDGESEVLYANAYKLLEDASGAGATRDFLRAGAQGIEPEELALNIGDVRDFARANRIEEWRKRFRDQLLSGQDAVMPPIRVTVDDKGLMWIEDGQDRLAAAIMEGFDAVPIHKVDFFGEAFTGQTGYYFGKTIRLSEAFRDTGETARSFFPGGLEEGKLSGGSFISPDYKLLNAEGQSVPIPVDSLDSSGAGVVMARIIGFITQGPAMTEKTSSIRGSSFIQKLLEEHDSLHDAAVTLSELVERSRNFEDFSVQLERMTGMNLANTRDTTIIPQSSALFEEAVRPAARTHLDELATKGVVTQNTATPERYMAAARGTGLTVEVFDEEANAVRYYSSRKRGSDLHRTAKGMLEQAGGPESIEPYARIIAQGSDGEEVVKEVRQFVEGPHPSLREAIVPERTLRISAQRADELRKQGILVNPSDEQMSEAGVNFGVLLGREDTGKFARPTYAYIVTNTGDIIVDTDSEDAAILLEKIFGTGKQSVQEFGVITTGRVVVSNPLGSVIERLTQAEVNVLRRRLQHLANRFRKMGLTDSTVMDVVPPFDPAVWERMYGSRTTIGEVLDEKFKLRIPKLIEGMETDVRLRAPLTADEGEVAFRIKRERIKDPVVAKIVKYLRDTFDEQFYQTVLKEIPLRYTDSYFPRTLTQGAKQALNENAFKWIEEKARVHKLRNLESFFKARVFTDFTTDEINALIKEAQRLGIPDAESIPSEIAKIALERYNKTLNIRDAQKFSELARILPNDVELFVLDPFLAASVRFKAGDAALTRKAVVDQLESFSMWSGTPKDLRELQVSREPFEKVEAKIRRATERLARARDDLQNFKAGKGEFKDTTEEMLIQRVSQIDEELSRLHVEKANKLESFVKAKSARAWDVDAKSNRVWISGEDATKLVREGVLRTEDVIGDVSDILVQVPFGRYETHLDKFGARVMLLPPEMEAIAQRYFSVTRKEGFGNFLRWHDEALSLWRTWTLFPIPAYHGRNLISNIFLQWLAGDISFPAMKDTFQLFKVLRLHRNGKLNLEKATEALKSMVFSTPGGDVIDGVEMYSAFVRGGGLSGGVHINEFGNFGNVRRSSELLHELSNRGMVPSSELAGGIVTDNILLRGGHTVAASIENHFRFSSFLQEWQRTGDFTAAERHMKAAFYDYRNLNAFERDWMRRIMPFYSWSRHNIPRMVMTLATKPSVHYRISEMAKTLEYGANNGRPVDDKDLSNWVRDQFGLVFAREKDGNYLVKTAEGFLPVVDAWKVVSLDGIVTMFKNGVTPFAKVPVEQLTNTDFYRSKLFGRPEEQQEIEEFAGQRARAFTLGQAGFTRRATPFGPLGVLNILLNESLFRNFFRPGQEAVSRLDPWFDYWLNEDNYRKEKPSVPVTMLALAVGRMYSVDPAMARAARARRFRRDLNKYEGMRIWALKQGRRQEAADLDSLINFERMQMYK